MEKITFNCTKPKKNGLIRVRYRLREGRMVQLCHRSDIEASLLDLEKFNPDGTTKPRIQVYSSDLAVALKEEYNIMVKAYAVIKNKGLDRTSAVFEQVISEIKNPVELVRAEKEDIVARLRRYAAAYYRDGLIGKDREKHIYVVADKLERYLIIYGIRNISAEEFNLDRLMEFREFVFNEYKYVIEYENIYKDVKDPNKPTHRLSKNTVSTQLKILSSFFSALEDQDEIDKSPFHRMSKERRKTLFRTMYGEPFFLRKEELLKIIRTNVAPTLQDTKDAFVVQCAFGCRVSDLALMTMNTIAVSEEGIPFVHYFPKKENGTREASEEVKTPIVRYAFDIIMRTGFSFPIVKNVSGKDGYNARIKALLQQCKINRQISKYNEATNQNEYVPLYRESTSKLARKTHIDLMSKIQIDLYASGLHKEGSSAVKRYTHQEIRDQFALLNLAFDQRPYYVNEDLTIKKQ